MLSSRLLAREMREEEDVFLALPFCSFFLSLFLDSSFFTDTQHPPVTSRLRHRRGRLQLRPRRRRRHPLDRRQLTGQCSCWCGSAVGANFK